MVFISSLPSVWEHFPTKSGGNPQVLFYVGISFVLLGDAWREVFYALLFEQP